MVWENVTYGLEKTIVANTLKEITICYMVESKRNYYLSMVADCGAHM